MGGKFLFFGLALHSDFEEKFAKKCKNAHEFPLNLLFFVKNTLVAIIFFEKYLVCSQTISNFALGNRRRSLVLRLMMTISEREETSHFPK